MTGTVSSKEFLCRAAGKCMKAVAFGQEKREEPGKMRGGQIAPCGPMARVGQRKDL